MRVYGQGKLNEAFGFLEPLARLTEPENPIANGNYIEGIGMLGGISFDLGRIDDAVKCEKMMFVKIGPARYARRISHLPTRYGEFVKSLKYV
ncbi:hypothetical protein TIFTF001_036779 [Ficus carica]|uniref:Uncharacterized protein n=1 Tax=Ficus carica TaxID=3494 RepID=A0AA88JBN1_FICCA|nr:hypothetical protein TIFTF001_036773 [Ficus carica]GMN67718.1 hypothetical protein TIFTF001_036779 [Ficus carica]